MILLLCYILQVTASTSVGSGPPATSGLVVVPEASEYSSELQINFILNVYVHVKCYSWLVTCTYVANRYNTSMRFGCDL